MVPTTCSSTSLAFGTQKRCLLPGFRCILLLLLVVLITACSFLTERTEAEQTAEAFFEDRIVSGGIGREHFYSQFFWARNSKKKREYLQRMVLIALGDLKSYSLQRWAAQSKKRLRNPGERIVVLIYDTKYQRGAGQEEITLYKKNEEAKFRIIGHEIRSPRLDTLLRQGVDLTPQEV